MLSCSQTILKIILFTVAAIILLLRPNDVFCAQSHEIGIVIVNRLNMRSKPGINNTSLKIISKGTRIEIIKHFNGWLKIKHQGRIGYIRNLKRYVRIESKSTKKEITPDFNSDIEPIQKEAKNINRKIKKGEADVLTFTKKEAAIINSLNDIDLALNQARIRAAPLKTELAAIENKMAETTNTSKDIQNKINAGEGYASKRLVALYKLSWLGRVHVLASAQSMHELFQRKKTLEQVLAYDKNILQNLWDNKARLQQLFASLNAQKKEKISLEAKLNKQIEIMSREKAKRSRLLNDIRDKVSLKMASLEALKQAAAELDQTITAFTWEYGPPEQIEIISPNRFPSRKGLLIMPVNGKIVSFYGSHNNAKFNVVNFQSGIKIKADRGEPIHAVCDGLVLYASWFKGYGNMIIIDHGDNYHTVYAHAEEIFMSKGDTVETGQVVATVGDLGSMIGPSLHFEVRHHGKPLDPLQWINKG
jgi:septal ring factor EnvC (AmiA/AmiB activator)